MKDPNPELIAPKPLGLRFSGLICLGTAAGRQKTLEELFVKCCLATDGTCGVAK